MLILYEMQEHEQKSQNIIDVIDHLRHDLDKVNISTGDLQEVSRTFQATLAEHRATNDETNSSLRELHNKMTVLESHIARAGEDKKDVSAKLENNVNLIWDQIRHVESSLSQRLTLAETSQVSTLQEVDEMKESAHEVMGRVEDVKRHIAALESKLESFNTQVAAALSPLHSR